MSTVKIKTEPTAAATAVDVKVKPEPSLSAADIKLEQHTSDIDTKVEFDSEADSEDEEIKSEDDDSDGDSDQNQFTVTPKSQRQFICDYSGCGRSFVSSGNLRMHQHEHRVQSKLNILGKTYILTRHSLNDRWACPIPSCTSTYKTVDALRCHIRKLHDNSMEQQQHQQSPAKKTRYSFYFLDVDSFYGNEVRCGYHITTGVFICHACRLVPECLLTHLQQKHGFDEKSIDNSALPESAVNASADPNINQHTSNSHLASAISQPHLRQHQNIVQGWLCVTSDCGYCGLTVSNKTTHKQKMHQSEKLTTVPALVLRLLCSKSRASYFLITCIDQVTVKSNRVNRHKFDYSHDGLSTQDDSEDDISQNETTEASNRKRQWKCEYPNCRRVFISVGHFNRHKREHKLEAVINTYGTTFVLTRQSSDDRWPCPVPNCESTCKSIQTVYEHIQKAHSTPFNQKRVNIEDDNDQQPQQQNVKRRQLTIYYLKMDGFYVSDVRCGYHNTIGVFVCHECRLVPECLLKHLQRKHGYDEKTVDHAILPESARIIRSDPNGNQHTSNTHLAAAIRNPYLQHHRDIFLGWQCVAPNCGYCCSTLRSRSKHQRTQHQDEQQTTVPALVLRLLYGKAQTSCFLITRLDAIADSVNSNISMSQNSSERDDDDDDDDDDGDDDDDDDDDELVLSDYSDEDDIH